MRWRPALVLVVAPLLPGCQERLRGWQAPLDPAGPFAEAVARQFWTFTAILGTVWALVVVVLAAALLRRRRERPDPLLQDPAAERTMTAVVASLTVLTALTVVALTAVSYAGQARLFGPRPETLTILVTGKQWWWDIRYEHAEPSQIVSTANEIHVPVGEPVILKLESADVIHSFWVPSLAGKMDAVPGRQNVLRLQADRPGVYRTQCAEFCGWQHAHMAMMVVAEPRADFDAWRQAQIDVRHEPADHAQREGEKVFLTHACVSCHTIRGTSAGSRVGPDLTHVASRRTIAAGALPMDRSSLAAWIADPQGIKPGARMPLVPLPPDALQAVSAYLEGLR